MNKEILPVLDMKVLQQKANEAAMNGAIDSIERFYNGYDSLYKKEITAQLESQKTSFSFDLPDIIALINDSVSEELTKIANTAVAQTFVPMIRKSIVRANKEMLFSEILKQFIYESHDDHYDDFELEMEDDDDGFIWVTISDTDKSYRMMLYCGWDQRKLEESKRRYHLSSLPSSSKKGDYRESTMTLEIDGAKIEMPFRKDVLQNRFISFLATLVIAETQIEMDVDEIDYDMFESDCHC